MRKDDAANLLFLAIRFRKRGVAQDKLINSPVDTTNHKAQNHHDAHHSFQRYCPTIDARAQILAQVGEVFHRTTREDEGNVRPKTKERIEFFRLLDSSDLKEIK